MSRNLNNRSAGDPPAWNWPWLCADEPSALRRGARFAGIPSRLCELAFTALVFGLLLLGSSTVRAGTVTLKLGDPEPLPAKLYEFNCDLLAASAFQGITFGGIEIENGVRELRPVGLRFPGGTPANNYLWREDSFSAQPDDLTGWAGKQIDLFRQIGRKYDLPGYIRLCRAFKLEPVWVLNVYEETPESVVALLDHLDASGLDLRVIELANEPYWDPRSLNDVDGYIRCCKPLVAAIRKHKTDVEVGACFAPLINEPFDYREKWNAVLAKENWYDAIVYHDYYGGQGFALEKGAQLPAKALIHPEAFIDGPVDELTRQAPGRPIWFTEWNIGSEGIQQWKNKGAELLFLGAMYTSLIKHRNVIERSLFHQLYESGFGTYHLESKTGTITKSASYEFFELLGTAFAKATQLRTATFDDENVIGFATLAGTEIRLFVINRGAESVTTQLPASFTGPLQCRTLECPPEQTLRINGGLAQTRELTGQTVNLPPFSISLVAPSSVFETSKSAELAGLPFPVRPFFTFWYPPYAGQQPRVDPTGLYSLDFANLKDKEMAVAKMDLTGPGLKAGGTYAVSFEARAEPEDSLTVNLPEALSKTASADDKPSPRSEWTPLAPEFRPLRFVFDYDPEVNNGELAFFFDRDTLTKGGKFEFRHFKIVELDPQ